jgi:hypothetical protein
MSSQFEANFRGIGDMLRSPEMQAEMERRAGKAKEVAEAIAPVGPGKDGSHYKDAFSVEARPRHDRACAALVNDDAAAFYVEHGTKNNEAHHVLLRSMDAMGD